MVKANGESESEANEFGYSEAKGNGYSRSHPCYTASVQNLCSATKNGSYLLRLNPLIRRLVPV